MATYYINADTGNDTTGDGSSGTPWLTISKAYTSSTTDDTIILQDSTATYSWAQMSISNRTIQGTTRASCVISGTGSGLGYIWLMSGNLTISNVEFTGVTGMGNAGVSTTASPFKLAGGTSTLSFTNCVFRNMVLPGSTSSVRPNGGLFSSQWAQTITATISFTSCLFYGLSSNVTSVNAKLFTTVSSSASSNTYTYNLTNCTVNISEPSNANLSGFYHQTGNAAPYENTLTVTHKNVIVNNESGETFPMLSQVLATTNFNLTTTYNDYYSTDNTGFTLGTGDITGDPLFVDSVNANFELRPTSPCLGTGTIV